MEGGGGSYDDGGADVVVGLVVDVVVGLVVVVVGVVLTFVVVAVGAGVGVGVGVGVPDVCKAYFSLEEVSDLGIPSLSN